MIYKLAGLMILIGMSFSVNAGRMPNEVARIESAGKGYVKLYSVDSEIAGEYHIIQTIDVKRIVGGEKQKECYMFYFTGIELLKLPIKNQNCEAVLSELIKSNE